MLYLVSMAALETSLLPSDQNVQILEKQLIPGIEAIIKLQDEKTILAGGVVVGGKSGVFIIEAASNEDLDRLLLSLPQWNLVKVDVTPLQSYSSRLPRSRETLKRLKATL